MKVSFLVSLAILSLGYYLYLADYSSIDFWGVGFKNDFMQPILAAVIALCISAFAIKSLISQQTAEARENMFLFSIIVHGGLILLFKPIADGVILLLFPITPYNEVLSWTFDTMAILSVSLFIRRVIFA